MRVGAIDVYRKMREKIIAGDYMPGASLTEMELANTFSISRNTVQKVLLMLANDELVTLEQNKGAKVRAYTLKEILEYTQIREVMEGLIVTLAVPHITPAQVTAMRGILERMKQKLEARDLLAYSACNKELHQILYDACPNRSAVDYVKVLKNQISKFNAKTILIPGRDEQSFHEHTAIVEAIAAGDAQLAAHCMREHISNVGQKIEEYDKLIF